MAERTPGVIDQAKIEFLYGYDGAERLHTKPQDVAEHLWDSALEESEGPFLVEKWTVAPSRSHLPEPWRVLDFIGEWTSENGEVTEDFDDHMMNLIARPEVVAQMEATLDFIAGRIGYYMADNLVETQTWWRRGGKFVRVDSQHFGATRTDSKSFRAGEEA